MNTTDRMLEALGPPDKPETRTNEPEPASEHASGVRHGDRTQPGRTHSPANNRPPALALEPDILGRFLHDLRRIGVAGEERTAALIYLAVTSRCLPWGRPGERPISPLVKGTSSTGKSYLSRSVLRFFPEGAWIDLGSMSRRYLFYTEESFEHRFLVIHEWASIKDDEEIVAMLRVLMSEGRIVHGTVEGEGKKAARTIQKDGPTGLLLTTTEAAVDAELETRMLSMTTDDTPEQTRRIFAAIAQLEDDVEEVDLGPWHELQEWIAAGENRTYVPFAQALAELMPTGATRLRRDFEALLSLIRAHALLYRAQRDTDERGRIVATVDDYAAVRELVGEIIAEGVEESASDAMRKTVEAVQALIAEGSAHVSPSALVKRLNVGKSATYDRINRALRAGFLVNDAGRGERAKRLVLGAPLPGASDFLPAPEQVVRVSSVEAPGHENPHGQDDPERLSGIPAIPGDPPDDDDVAEAERLAEKHADLLNGSGLHRMLDRREIAHLARAGFALCGIAADELHDADGKAPRCSNCLRTSDGARADWGDA